MKSDNFSANLDSNNFFRSKYAGEEISQWQASATFSAYSIAVLFNTGNAPGTPQADGTGMRVGGAAGSVLQPQNTLEAVASSA